MPLTKKGKKIKRAMQQQYGKKKGEQVFYASQNNGRLKGTHKVTHNQTGAARMSHAKKGKRKKQKDGR